MNSTSDDRIIGLWATPFLNFVPDAHERYRTALADLAARHVGKDILANGDDAARWLRGQIEETVSAYFDRWAEAGVPAYTIIGRTLVHGHSDYQPLRNHADAYLSGLYYVNVPTDVRDDHHRFDADSNALSFYDPRFAMNMGAIAKDPNANLEKQIRPESGAMFVWPSFVDYFMHPNLSAEKQISVQFNVVLGDGA